MLTTIQSRILGHPIYPKKMNRLKIKNDLACSSVQDEELLSLTLRVEHGLGCLRTGN